MADAGQQAGSWGRWGDEDERGALNLITPEGVLEAVRTCKTGRIYQLGLPIQREGIPSIHFRGPAHRLTLASYVDDGRYDDIGGTPGIGANEDMLMLASHSSTHMDALCHVYDDGTIYNGLPREGMKNFDGAVHCGIEKAGGFVARGVLIDVAKTKGVDCLPESYAITPDDLVEALARSGEELRAGDMVIIRTGWLERFFANGAQMEYAQPGIGLDAAKWLAHHDPVAIGADNTSVEAYPYDTSFLSCHIELLVRRGIYLMEHIRVDELSADGCTTFLFCVAPLLITGATASPVNPLAIG
jgi:kynurenine formamidase